MILFMVEKDQSSYCVDMKTSGWQKEKQREQLVGSKQLHSGYIYTFENNQLAMQICFLGCEGREPETKPRFLAYETARTELPLICSKVFSMHINFNQICFCKYVLKCYADAANVHLCIVSPPKIKFTTVYNTNQQIIYTVSHIKKDESN